MKIALLNPKNIVTLWIAGFFGSFVIQSVFQTWFAESTIWGRNIGWQTEIAIWNIGMLGVLLPLRQNSEYSRKAIPGLFALSLAFGLNHFQAFIRAEQFQLGNLLGFTFNFLAVILGSVSFKVSSVKANSVNSLAR